MQFKIHNPNKLPTIDYRKAQPLQDDLKDLSKINYDKLKNVLTKRGFTTPLFIWMFEDTPYIVDGHQRQRVMAAEDMSDNGSYEVPYLLIEAPTIQDAKAQLLEISSQYGTITQEGLDHFIAIDELPEAEVYEAVHFDALATYDVAEEDSDGEEKDKREARCKKCPIHCVHAGVAPRDETGALV